MAGRTHSRGRSQAARRGRAPHAPGAPRQRGARVAVGAPVEPGSLAGLPRKGSHSGSSRAGRGPPGDERKTKTHQPHHYQHERYRAPPVLPEGTKPMGAHTPGPEDAEQQEDGADDLANPTHGPKVSPCPPPSPGAPCRTRQPGAQGNAGADRSAHPSAPAAAVSSSA